tara:strand:+ start:2729 stop:2953 length:225 start_codon:yes stop_codon:yes gene_type:complete
MDIQVVLQRIVISWEISPQRQLNRKEMDQSCSISNSRAHKTSVATLSEHKETELVLILEEATNKEATAAQTTQV